MSHDTMASNTAAAEACHAYMKALEQRAKYLPAIEELLQLKVCPRCCLRFAGIRDALYAAAAPASEELLAAVTQLLQQSSQSEADTAKHANPASNTAPAHVPADAPPSDSTVIFTPHTSQATAASTSLNPASPSPPDAAKQAQLAQPAQHTDAATEASATPDAQATAPAVTAAAVTDAAAAAAAQVSAQPQGSVSNGIDQQQQQGHGDPGHSSNSAIQVPCPACLGVLQGAEKMLEAVPAAMLAGLPEAEGNAGEWKGCSQGNPDAVAACVRQEGHVPTDIGLDITIPAATVTRQLSLLQHLRTKFASQGLYTNPNQYQELVDLKDAVKLAVGNPLAERLGVKCNKDGTLRVLLAYLHPASSYETDFVFPAGHGKGRGYKRKRGQPKVIHAGRSASETVAQQAGRLSQSVLAKHCATPPLAPAVVVGMAYRVVRRPVYVAGRYLKLLRGIAQSPWFIDGHRKGVSSVEERIADVVLPAFKADKHKFMTAGREDFDVRMLGSGRPFVLEIINPRAACPNQQTMTAMQNQLDEEDHGVQVQALQVVDRSICTLLKAGESEKQKSYTAVCQLPTAITPEMVSKINATQDLVLHQQTPVRVSHRRADLVRHRTVYQMQCELIDGNRDHFILHLRTQAGTYIKEFVHSDEGRTQPHLASLLALDAPARILQLDVNQIHMDFLNASAA